MELNSNELINYVNRQLTNIFGEGGDISPYLADALLRVNKCFKATKNKYYHNAEGVYFSPFHSGQYAIFLYYLANTIYHTDGNSLLATKVYYLNKILHSTDWYYEIELPEYWGVEHPLGTVLGRAKYSNGFFSYHGCTVGGNKGKYPVMGKNVILYSNVTVIGDTKIGDQVILSAGTMIKDEIIPCNCLVFGQSPKLSIKKKDEKYMKNLISEFWIT
ncbi:transferase [Acetobacterium sp.]|uniref:transferase n=1 Tax=Acetobacterium sp. TaxID=1872094 RepID=UPI002F40FF9E